MSFPLKKRYLINVVGGLAIFVYLQYRLGVGETVRALAAADPGFLVLALLVFLLSQLIRLVKWRVFYRQARIRTNFTHVSHFYFKLKFFGILTPGRIGEFLPALTSPNRKGSLFSFTTYDRLTESMTTLTVAILAFTYLLRGVFAELLPIAVGLVGVIALISFLCVRNAWMMALASRVGKGMERFRHRERVDRILSSEKKIGIEIRRLQRAFRQLFLPGMTVMILAITAVAVAADLLFWWLLFRAVHVLLSPATLVAAVAIFNVTGFFSPTPGGIGISDTFFVLFLRSIGETGALGSFVILLRVAMIAMTALCYFSLHFGIEARRARRGDSPGIAGHPVSSPDG